MAKEVSLTLNLQRWELQNEEIATTRLAPGTEPKPLLRGLGRQCNLLGSRPWHEHLGDTAMPTGHVHRPGQANQVELKTQVRSPSPKIPAILYRVLSIQASHLDQGKYGCNQHILT